MLLLEDSTNGREKRYNLEHWQRNLMNVLRRPVEVATQSRRQSIGLRLSRSDLLFARKYGPDGGHIVGSE
jgi:hypothetical protein